MWCRFFCAAVMLCLATFAAAQDPTKVEPKHYKLQFENERVQVVNVHYGPHEKSEMHDHPGGVVVVVTGGHLKFTDQNGKITEVSAKAGESRWFPPFKHRVENLGDEPYNAVYIGIKGKVAADSPVRPEHLGKNLDGFLAASSATLSGCEKKRLRKNSPFEAAHVRTDTFVVQRAQRAVPSP